MSFGLWDLLLAGLLLVNAVAVLNEQRFLVHSTSVCFSASSFYFLPAHNRHAHTHNKKYTVGFSTNSLNEPGFGQQQQQQQASVKSRLITLISSVQMLLRSMSVFAWSLADP